MTEAGAGRATPARRPGLFTGGPLAPEDRLLLALLVGVGAGLGTWAVTREAPQFLAKDFTYPWRAARALVDGHDPYAVIRPTGIYPFESAFPYPLTAAVAALPFQGLRAPLAAALFLGLSSALAAWALLREGLWRLWTFATPMFVMTVLLAQWPPLLVAGALLPPLAWALACKPTLGLALFAWRPNRWAVIGGAALTLVALAILPSWPREWLAVARTIRGHPPPLLQPFGWLPLLALLRWRRPEARLVAVLACVPQNPYFYDQLPLALVAWNGRTAALLTGLAWGAWQLTERACHSRYFCGEVSAPYVLWLCYVPAMLLVLWRDRHALPVVGRWLGGGAAPR